MASRMAANDSVRVQAVASSMPRGIPSSSWQMRTMAGASAGDGWKPGRRRRTPWRNSWIGAVALQLGPGERRGLRRQSLWLAAVRQEVRCRRHIQPFERDEPLVEQVEPRARGHQQLEARRRGQHLQEQVYAVRQVLEVVQDQEHLLVAQEIQQPRLCWESVLRRCIERTQDGVGDELGVGDGGQGDEVHAVGKMLPLAGDGLERQPGLAHAAGSDHGEQPAGRVRQARGDVRELGLPAEEGRVRERQAGTRRRVGQTRRLAVARLASPRRGVPGADRIRQRDRLRLGEGAHLARQEPHALFRLAQGGAAVARPRVYSRMSRRCAPSCSGSSARRRRPHSMARSNWRRPA